MNREVDCVAPIGLDLSRYGSHSPHLDGNGMDEIIFDRGDERVFMLVNGSSLSKLEGRAPESMTTGNID